MLRNKRYSSCFLLNLFFHHNPRPPHTLQRKDGFDQNDPGVFDIRAGEAVGGEVVRHLRGVLGWQPGLCRPFHDVGLQRDGRLRGSFDGDEIGGLRQGSAVS